MSKNMKRFLCLVLALVMILPVLAGCGGQEEVSSAPEVPVTVNVTAIAGPTGVGMVDLMQKQADGKAANAYTFNVVTAPDQAVAAISNGTADIAAVPLIEGSDVDIAKAEGGRIYVTVGKTEGFDLIMPKIAVLSMALDTGKAVMANRRRQRIIRQSGGAGKRLRAGQGRGDHGEDHQDRKHGGTGRPCVSWVAGSYPY